MNLETLIVAYMIEHRKPVLYYTMNNNMYSKSCSMTVYT